MDENHMKQWSDRKSLAAGPAGACQRPKTRSDASTHVSCDITLQEDTLKAASTYSHITKSTVAPSLPLLFSLMIDMDRYVPQTSLHGVELSA